MCVRIRLLMTFSFWGIQIGFYFCDCIKGGSDLFYHLYLPNMASIYYKGISECYTVGFWRDFLWSRKYGRNLVYFSNQATSPLVRYIIETSTLSPPKRISERIVEIKSHRTMIPLKIELRTDLFLSKFISYEISIHYFIADNL